MDSRLAVFADSDTMLTQSSIDFATGQVKEERFKLGDACRSRGIRFTPMEHLKDKQVYEKKGKKDGETKPVKLGDLGPIVLLRMGPSGIVNEFSARDLRKPISLSWETLCELSELFGGQRSGKGQKEQSG